jgi:DNA-directed RNA polymerase specialized sigma24 family protein
VLRHWAERDPQQNSVAWLYRIATNTAFDELRRVRRRQTCMEGAWQTADPDPSLEG